MRSYSLIAPAKINLYLEIIGDRSDNFHELVMILQSIDLADQITISANSLDTIRISCDHPQVPTDETNLAYRAAQLMREQFPESASTYGGIDIVIDKKIPVAAGLAGGSSNAAAVLVGMNLMWNLGLTQPELQSLGAVLGSDVPFCLAGGTALATGRGEKLDPLPDLDNIWVVLAKYKSLTVSTGWAYSSYREQFNHLYVSEADVINSRAAQVHSGPLVSAIIHKDPEKIGNLLHNDLEKVVFPEYPQVAQLCQVFLEAGGNGTMMSGSGPTVFSLCGSFTQAEAIMLQVQEKMADPDLEFWLTSLCTHGISL